MTQPTDPVRPPMPRTLNQHGRRIAAELTEVRQLAEGDRIGPHMMSRTTAHKAVEKLAGVIEGVLLYELPIWESPEAAATPAPTSRPDTVTSIDASLLQRLQSQLRVIIEGEAHAGWADVVEGDDPESHAVSRAAAMEHAGDAIGHQVDALFVGEGPVEAIARRFALYRRRIEELEAKLAVGPAADGTPT